MPRISKEPAERRDEIMNAAQTLFLGKGFHETRIEEIVQALSLSKGIFYYYFKSKEEILDAIINRYVDDVVEETRAIIEDRTVPLLKRIELTVFMELKINSERLPGIRKIKNIDIAPRMNKCLVEKYAPLLAALVEEGISEGLVMTDRPLSVMEILLVMTRDVFDPGVFQWTRDEVIRKAQIVVDFLETSLKAPKGSFDFMIGVFGGVYGINDGTGKGGGR